MSLRNRVALSIVALLSLAFLAGCGSSSTQGVAPPSGGFSNSNLNGTYVFSVSGTDVGGDPYAIVGTFTANGQGGNGTGGITGGTIDVNDFGEFTPAATDASIGSGSSYTVGADGRGQAHLTTSTPFGTIVLDFVLQDSSHGLVTEFDDTASGSGTLDIQTANTTPSGSYAFSLSGVNSSSGTPFATVGNFTLGSSGTITSGLEDYNSGGLIYNGSGAGLALSGTVVAGPSTSPATVLITSSFGLTFDVYPIDASHLKFIETDENGSLSGDAYSQTSTSMPAGTLPFTLAGELSGEAPFVAGGFMVTDSSGDITNSSSEDLNDAGSPSSAPLTFSGSYVASGAGRYVLDNFSGFEGGGAYAAYPSSAGVFLLEIDSSLAIESGIAYPAQTSGATFSSGQGYGMNLTGTNLANEGVEVDEIAEFTANSSGSTITGYADENYAPGGVPQANIPFINNSSSSSVYSTPSDGRGQIAASLNDLNGGFILNYYVVDGTTFPFIELDNSGQVSSGVLLEQNSSSTAAAAKATIKHLFVPKPLISKKHAARQNKNKSK
jgi:hypothetical protein